MKEIIDKWELKIAQAEVAQNYIGKGSLAYKALDLEIDLMKEFINDMEVAKNNIVLDNTSKHKHQYTYDWGYVNGYEDCAKGLPKRDDLGVYDD